MTLLRAIWCLLRHRHMWIDPLVWGEEAPPYCPICRNREMR